MLNNINDISMQLILTRKKSAQLKMLISQRLLFLRKALLPNSGVKHLPDLSAGLTLPTPNFLQQIQFKKHVHLIIVQLSLLFIFQLALGRRISASI